MKKITKRVFSFLIALAMMTSLTGISMATETNETKTVYPDEVYRWDSRGCLGTGYCWVNAQEMVVPFTTGDNSGIKIKSATLELGLLNNSNWKYDAAKTYIADVNCLYNNDWDETTSYEDMKKNIVADDAVTATSVDTTVDASSPNGVINADVTNMVKKGLENGEISFIVSKNKASDDEFTFNRTSKTIKLNITYYTDEEFVSVLNSATEENIDDIIVELNSGYVNAYKQLIHKESIINTLLGITDYESVADFTETFETAYLDYMADPEPEDIPGTKVSVTFTDYASAQTNSESGLKYDYAYIGAYNVVRALIKFDISDINRDYVRNVILKYKTKAVFPNAANAWYTYDSTADYTTIVDGISSEWASTPYTTAVEDLPELSKNANTINKDGFVENTEVSKTYKAEEHDTYGVLAANVTADFLSREITDGNISYMLRKMETPGYVISDDGEFVLEIEYLNDAELLEKINGAETADTIAGILASGIFNDNQTYKAYSELNNKTVINEALFAGITYESMEAFKTAFDDAYAAYMENPSAEDVAGETYTIAAELTGSHDGTNGITNLTCYGNQYDMRALIRTDISGINPEYVRKVRLVYPLESSYGGFWNYSTEADYKGTVQQVINEWAYGDTWVVHSNESFFIDKNVATISNSGTQVMKADVTKNVLTQIEAGETKISYLIRKDDITTPAAYVDPEGFIGLEVELINDYELVQLINKAETGEKIGEILESGLFDDNETYIKYAKLNNKTTVNEALVGTYEDIDAFNAAFETAYLEYLKNPSYEDKAGLTKTISFVEYGRTDTSQKKDITADYASIGSYGSERALIKFNIGDINRSYVKKATLTYKLKDKFSTWFTYDPEKDYSATVMGISSDWTSVSADNTETVPDNAKYANTLDKTGFIENDNVATSYKKVENTTYAVMGADITEDFLSREITDGNISYMLKRDASYDCVISTDGAYSIEIEYLNEYELLEKYKTVKDDKDALTDYITEIVKIEDLSGITPSVVAMFIYGKNFDTYEELIDAIEGAGKDGTMMVVNESVTAADTITGTFSVNNLNEGEATDTFYAIVASYTADNEMIESYIIDMDGEAIEIDQMYYDEELGEYVIGESDELTFTLTENVSEVSVIKVFLWDGFNTMKPYGEATEIYKK